MYNMYVCVWLCAGVFVCVAVCVCVWLGRCVCVCVCVQCVCDVGIVYCVSVHGATKRPRKRETEDKSPEGKR